MLKKSCEFVSLMFQSVGYVTCLWDRDHANFVVEQEMRDQSSQPGLVWDHVRVQDSDIRSRPLIEGIGAQIPSGLVHVAGLETVMFAWILGPTIVVDVGVLLLELGDLGSQLLVQSIVRDQNPKFFEGPVERRGSSDRIHDDLDIFLACGDDHIDAGYSVTEQAAFGADRILAEKLAA
jgi:hypothetical protein